MPRRSARPQPDRTIDLTTRTRECPACGRALWAANKPRRTVATLDGVVRLRLQVRGCRNPECPRRGVSLRPELEGRFVLPGHEFGLDVIALVGALRHAEHRSIPEIHAELVRRGVAICVRSVGNLLDRYDELLALSCSNADRLKAIAAKAGRVSLAIDGLQPDIGHEVLWVIRDVLSGEVLLARGLLSSSQDDLARLLTEAREALGNTPIAGVVSDGQTSIRKAVAQALPGVPHQLTRLRPIGPADLVPSDVAAWRGLRASLERRQAVRALGRRFRRDPDAYLKSLETSLINRVLPT